VNPASASSPKDELELKARVPDAPALRAALERADAALQFRGAMLDRRLDRDDTLDARDEVLRLRTYAPADGSPAYGVLAWKGPVGARRGYRHRAELEARIPDPDATLAILERAGFTVTLRIDRTVEIFHLAGAVLRIETYPAMDVLLEVEGEPAAIERAIVGTALPRAAFVPQSLEHFVAAYEARTGRRARLSTPS
jgi:adenylate cyclase class IV